MSNHICVWFIHAKFGNFFFCLLLKSRKHSKNCFSFYFSYYFSLLLCTFVRVCGKPTKNYAKVFGLSLFLYKANGCECCEFSSCGLFGFVSFLRLFSGFRWGSYRAQVSGLELKSVSVKFHM